MNKLSTRKAIVIVTVAVVILLSAGCANHSVNEPNSVYIAETIPFPALPSSLITIGIIHFADNAVYVTAWEDGDEHEHLNSHRILTMDVDGTTLVELPNYLPGSLPTSAANSYVYISALHVDTEGYIWVAEYRDLSGSDLIGDLNENIIRKLDETGSEILSFDLNNLASGNDGLYVHALSIESEGNIYIASMQNLFVLDDQGGLLFSLENPNILGSFIWLSDGSIAFTDWQDGNSYLRIIDKERRSWGEIINLPPDVPWIDSIFSGIDEYLYLYNDKTHLIGVIKETREHIKVFSWVDSALSSEDIRSVMLLSDGRIAATRQPISTIGTWPPVIELILLTETPSDELPEKIQLTFGTFDFDSSRRYAVEQFNKNSNTHVIKVIDYSQFNTDEDWGAGLLRLNTEIIAGNSPDILDAMSMPVQIYASKGLLVDLYPLIDADPEIDRDSIISSVLKATEIDGSLYNIIPSFNIMSIMGHPSVLGDYPGWNFDEFVAVLEANPKSDMPMGWYTSRMLFFTFAFRGNTDQFVDWESGTAYFDSDAFVELLELANTFPPEVDTDSTVPEHDLIAAGRQIMQMNFFNGATDYLRYRTLFGGDLVLKGLPNENRDGNTIVPSTNIAITSSCSDVGTAWEFVRLFLTEDYQRETTLPWMFPVNRVVFEEQINDAMIPRDLSFSNSHTNDVINVKDIKLSQVEADALRDIIENMNRVWIRDAALWIIVSETVESFFNDQITAQEAARIIQSRATIYISEQG